MAVILETSLGDMTVDLLVEERPKCCKNFLKLCKVKYYNFCLFHSVQKNLVAQTGDPTGTGRGGESVNGLLYGEQARYFDMELVPRIKHKSIGTVSMVNNGGNMHGSQFFFTLREDLEYLDENHTVFGEVSEGLDVLEKINETICDEDHRPYKDIRIFHTVILDDPFDDPPGLEVPDKSPEPTKEQLDSGRIGVYEAIDDNEGKTKAEIAEMMEEQEAKANAQLLEVIGDLPDADMAPPENVLFVCKLNPVTSEEDLELIFSRFGVIKSCEVIKDQKTGESLQYAFIEFEKQEDCERAYFKMDNVLIDDRRIHVDFSQSVAKVKWKGKGKGVQTFDKKDDSVPALKLKEQKKTHSNYDLVYDMDDERDRTEKNSRKSKKKSSHNEDRSYSSQKHKKHRSRSKSPARILKKRSSSPTYSKHRERSRSCSPSYRKQKDRSRDRSYKKDSHRRERSPEGRYRHKHRDRR